jgi:hypothetical protein
MKILASLHCLLAAIILSVAASQAQTELVRSHYFPAELEFKELGAIKSEQTLTDVDSPSGIPEGSLFADVGFEKYTRRVYSVGSGGSLTIEVVRLKDARAAFSLLTILRKGDISAGPPGDWFSASPSGLIFARGDYWVRVQGDSGPEDLSRRVATSVSNRIGNRRTVTPQLVSHFPKIGYEASSIRYYLGPKSCDSYASAVAGRHLKFESDMEVAQAQYIIEDMKGLLSLVSFPTSQLAEQYSDDLASMDQNSAGRSKVYLKRAGPLLGILEGTFDAGTANKILSSIQFTYAIKWIYDKNNRSNTKTIWGVPMPILGTVVRSLLLTALLCGISLFAGVGFAAFRLFLRGYAPHNYLDRPERTEIIRLKIDEK